MSTLSIPQLISYARQAGFSGQSLINAVAISLAESGGNPSAQNCNNPGGSCDRGAWQINSYWHPEVSDTCAYDPACAAKAAYTISNGGTSFSPWTTFQNGAYQQFTSKVSDAVNAITGGGSTDQTTTTTTSSSSSSSSSGGGGGVCDAPILGGIICSSWFEQGAIVFVGLLLALAALVVIAMPEAKKVAEEVA